MKTQFAFVLKPIMQQPCLRANSIVFVTTPKLLEMISDNLLNHYSLANLKGFFETFNDNQTYSYRLYVMHILLRKPMF